MDEFPGLRVLLVEDEGGIALLIEDLLESFGCIVTGSVARLSDAFEQAAATPFDVAILDVNVNGESSLPLASELIRRERPFIFSTGYGAGGLPEEFENCVVLAKPFTSNELRLAIGSALARVRTEDG